jgi:NTE family protein
VDDSAPPGFARTQTRRGLALALSGGGFRAMLFHAGAVLRMNELGLLPELARVSSVSGGSIAAAQLGLAWTKLDFRDGRATNLGPLLVDPILAFSRRTIDVAGTVAGALSQGWMVGPVMEAQYRRLFGEATLQDLPRDSEGPRFVINATNLATGALFRFSRPYLADWRLGRAMEPKLPLARAVAASAAFPPFLAPVRLDLSALAFEPWHEPLPGTAREIDVDHVPEAARRTAILADGGVYDNHGIEPIDDWPTILVSDGGAPFGPTAASLWNWYALLRRGWDLTDHQVRAMRRRALVARFTLARVMAGGDVPVDPSDGETFASEGAYWSVDSDPARFRRLGGLDCPPERVAALARVPTRLRDFGDATRFALVNWGYAVADKSLRRWVVKDAPPATTWPMLGGLG